MDIIRGSKYLVNEDGGEFKKGDIITTCPISKPKDGLVLAYKTKNDARWYISTYKLSSLPAEGNQIGGDHYSKLKIQPMDYCLKNNLNFGQSNAIKYITRYRDKNGIEDLKKAIHCIELLVAFEEKEKVKEKEKEKYEEGSQDD